MVKQLNITLDDKDHALLLKAKDDQSWREFIMTLTRRDK
jgi:hypothetical protein